jgi:hypothetical protein
MGVDERIDPTSLPFDEAIAFYRQKVNLPTEHWNDLWEGMHARAFVVAGATKAELLADLRGAIDKAIAEGTTLETFRKDFDGIVAKHGWSYNGERGWRTGVMLETNMRTAYAAGRYQQLTDPELLKDRPWWKYVHGDSKHPRPLHLSWNGTVLRYDDPWWQTHFCPNGWGCNCKVHSLSADDLKELGKAGPDTAPDDGTYTWTDKRTGEVREIPKGIDPGWGYNVGEAAWGKQLAEDALAARRTAGDDAWRRLTPGDWRSAERPERLPPQRVKAEPLPAAQDAQARAKALKGLLGGQAEKVFEVGAGGWKLPALVNAEALAGHVESSDAPLLGLLPTVLEEPQEVWVSFEKHEPTGRVALKTRVIKHVAAGARRVFLTALTGEKGVLEDWAVVAPQDVNRLRQGKLVFAKE